MLMLTKFKKKVRPLKKLLPLSSLEREKLEEANLLNNLYTKLVTDSSTKTRVEYILNINQNNPHVQNVLTEDERALPGDPNFLESGWYKSMLTRYAFAMHYSQGKRVLDTCSGFGWGAYLLEVVAEDLTCIELDRDAIEAAKNLWSYQKCVMQQGSVLEMPFPDNSFDVVTAMESIEHFDLNAAKTYRDEMYRVLKPNGALIGSTPLPLTEEGVRQELDNNPYHLYVFTPTELSKFLKETFHKVRVLHNNRFFWAIK